MFTTHSLTSTNLHCYSCWQDFLALLLDDLSVTQCDSISFELVSGTKLTSVEARLDKTNATTNSIEIPSKNLEFQSAEC